MKLYTEEQIRKAFYNGIEYSKTIHPASIGHHNQYVEEMIKSLTSIELPSNEEINERSYYDKDNDKLIVNAAEIARFRDGAKWLKDKILTQNK